MKRLLCFGLLLTSLVIFSNKTTYAQKPGAVSIRGGAGTDIEGGIAYGAQIGYILFQDPNAFEISLAGFGGKFEEDSNNGFHDYHEETTILVIGALANYLFRYSMELPGPYFVGGIGVGAISVEWEESSPTDVSLGTLLPGGGSKQSEDGSTAGLILNFGIGHRISQMFDLRAQVPTFFISASGEREAKVVPTFTVTAGLSF